MQWVYIFIKISVLIPIMLSNSRYNLHKQTLLLVLNDILRVQSSSEIKRFGHIWSRSNKGGKARKLFTHLQALKCEELERKQLSLTGIQEKHILMKQPGFS